MPCSVSSTPAAGISIFSGQIGTPTGLLTLTSLIANDSMP